MSARLLTAPVPTVGTARKPGQWSPGSVEDVRRAVTTMALHQATAAYFEDPNPDTWLRLIAAQHTADTAR